MMKTRPQYNFLTQQRVHINPIQEYRKSTDKPFIVLFTIIFLTWISITIQALVYPTVAKCRSENVVIVEDDYLLFDVRKVELSFSWKFLLCTFLSGMVAIVYIFLLFQPIISHVIIYFAISIVFVSSFASLTGIIMMSKGLHYTIIVLLLLFLLLYLVYQTVVLHCFGSIGVEAVFEIVGDACRAILFYPSSLLFVCSMSILIISILSLALFVIKRIPSYYMQDSHVITYCAIEIFGASVVIAFITNFTQIVISGFAIDWFWTKDKNLVSRYFIRKHIERTFSFHLGTVAFGSIPLLPNVCALLQACWSDSDSDVMVKKDNIFLRFVSQMSLLINARDFALIQTSIYGSDYITSITAAIDLVSQNPKLNLAVTEASNSLVMIGVVLTILPFEIEELYFAIYSIPVPFFIIMMTVFRALLVNKMIMQNTSVALKGLIVSLYEPSTSSIYYV